MSLKLALATATKFATLVPDDRLLVDALAHRKISANGAVWNDPAVRWSDYDAVVIRSCWDYHLHPSSFIRWLRYLEHMQVPLWNPTPILQWNLHKTYLRDLQAQGVAIPPTCWLKRSCTAELATILTEQGWKKAVIKPAISATAYQTWRTTHEQARQDQSRFATLLQYSDVLVQQFMDPVVTYGEWSFVFFHKQYSHAVLKKAQAGDFRVQDDFGGTVEVVSPGLALIEQAQQIVHCIKGPLLFARVDGIELDGRLILMELELLEPFLFLESDPHAVERFARAIVRALPNA